MKYKKGDIVLVRFPFTDMSNYKLRPALIISNKDFNNHGNFMFIGIYGNKGLGIYSSKIDVDDLKEGKMKKQSYFRFQNIFSLHKDLIEKKVGEIKDSKLEKIKDTFCDFLG